MSERTALRIIGCMLVLVFLLALGAVRSSWTEDETVRVQSEQQSSEGVHEKSAKDELRPKIRKQAPATDGQSAEKQSEANENASEFWPSIFGKHFKITDTLLIFFTGILAWKTWGLDAATRKLWEAGERQIVHVKTSSDAAKASADAAVAASRAHIRVIDLQTTIGNDSGYIIETEFGNSIKVDCRWKIKNFGSSPADVFGQTFSVGCSDQNSLNFNGISRDINQTIAAGEPGEQYSETMFARVTDFERDRLLARQSFIWINISFIYMDVFGKTQNGTVVWQYRRKSDGTWIGGVYTFSNKYL